MLVCNVLLAVLFVFSMSSTSIGGQEEEPVVMKRERTVGKYDRLADLTNYPLSWTQLDIQAEQATNKSGSLNLDEFKMDEPAGFKKSKSGIHWGWWLLIGAGFFLGVLALLVSLVFGLKWYLSKTGEGSITPVPKPRLHPPTPPLSSTPNPNPIPIPVPTPTPAPPPAPTPAPPSP